MARALCTLAARRRPAARRARDSVSPGRSRRAARPPAAARLARLRSLRAPPRAAARRRALRRRRRPEAARRQRDAHRPLAGVFTRRLLRLAARLSRAERRLPL